MVFITLNELREKCKLKFNPSDSAYPCVYEPSQPNVHANVRLKC